MENYKSLIRKEWLYVAVFIAVALNFSGINITIIAPDGALYASIAKSMVLRHNYTDLFAEGRNWLDKPHFPFWMIALSFKCFGFTTWAYKLPALLFLLMGAFYTYLFARRLYNEEIALWSVLILLTAEHIVISNNDVRAEPYLTGLIIASVYHFYNAYKQNKMTELVVACIFAACAVMTKGIFAMIPICGAIAGELIIKRQWKALFNFKWVLAALLIFLFIIPELYSLYAQFDMHPQLLMFGHHGVSGIHFFFWDSQFGRFLNTGPIKGQGDPFFFVHTTLWAFLPWSLILFAAVFQFIRQNQKNAQNAEWFCICGSLLTFLVFSASKFQLPFYTNIIYPFFAIITAQYLCKISNPLSLRVLKIVQMVVVILMLIITSTLQFFYWPENFNYLLIGTFTVLTLAIVALPGQLTKVIYQRVALMTFLAALTVNLYFNLLFYPSLLHYQAGSEAAFYINENNPEKLPVVQCMNDYAYPLEFYLNQPLYTANTDMAGNLPAKPYLLYVRDDDMKRLKQKGWEIRPVKMFRRFWITKLTPLFLNKNSREKALEYYWLVRVD